METKRLYLRERTPELLRQVQEMPPKEQMAFFGFDNDEKLARTLQRGSSNIPMRYWELLEKEGMAVIGNAGFHTWYPDHERAEIGYALHPSYQRKGYMREALKHLIEIGFTDMQLNRMEAYVGVENEASHAIMKTFGFHKEGVLRQHYKHQGTIVDSVVYGLIKEDYSNKAI